MVLRAVTGLSQVYFGYVVSGRNIPLAGIETAIGTYINQLICRIDFSMHDTAISVAQKIQDDYFDGLQHQHVSLTELYHELGIAGGRLFNTNMHLMRLVDANGISLSSLNFDYQHSTDPSEVSEI